MAESHVSNTRRYASPAGLQAARTSGGSFIENEQRRIGRMYRLVGTQNDHTEDNSVGHCASQQVDAVGQVLAEERLPTFFDRASGY